MDPKPRSFARPCVCAFRAAASDLRAGLLVASLLLASLAATDRESRAASSDRALRASFARPANIPFPADNPRTDARVELGRTLFFDPRLSGSNALSCAGCHNPGLSWGDGLPKAKGHGMKELGRRTPTVLNLAWSELLFWDGRAASLEEQALGPIQSPGEMNLPLDELVAKLRSIPGYAPLFERAYPGEPIDERTLAKAIATYERTIVSGRAPFDAWVDGDEQAVSLPAKRGFALFTGKAKCAECHAGWRFTDDSFRDVGVAGSDPGRAAILPGIEGARFAFKTPTLRSVALRAPYMHDGSEATLAAVIELYDRGGREKRPSLAPEIQPLKLSGREKDDLVAFLATLTSEDAPVVLPRLPR